MISLSAILPVPKVLSEMELGSPISATVTPANGTLYIATMKELFAIRQAAP